MQKKSFRNKTVEVIDIGGWDVVPVAPTSGVQEVRPVAFVPHPGTLPKDASMSATIPDVDLAVADVADGWAMMKNRDDVVDELSGSSTFAVPAPKTFGMRMDVVKVAEIARAIEQVQKLSNKDLILSTVGNNLVTCIRGNTGCGKSSIIPLEIWMEDTTRYIVIAQPRRLAAVGLATRVASMIGERVGQTVGFRLGGGSGDGNHQESERTRILYVTTGYLLESLTRTEALWKNCTHLILDEVHERTTEADFLALIVKIKLASKKHIDPTVPAPTSALTKKHIILMSATMQHNLFTNYFGIKAAELEISTNMFKVEEVFSDQFATRKELTISQETRVNLSRYCTSMIDASDSPPPLWGEVYRAAAEFIASLVVQNTAILVFLPGLNEIDSLHKTISDGRLLDNLRCGVSLCILHSTVETGLQQQATSPVTRGTCRIVLATNIAETSITIPDVKVVVDFGLARRIEYDPAKNMRSIVCGWCSQSAARQRAGRAGRVSHGIVYRLYPSTLYATMLKSDKSELLPLEHTALQCCATLASHGDVAEILGMLVEPPTKAQINTSIEQLKKWGMIVPSTSASVSANSASTLVHHVTKLGRIALSMPIDLSMTRMIINAAQIGCGLEMAVIASGLTIPLPLIPRPLNTTTTTPKEYAEKAVLYERAAAHFDRSRRNDFYAFLAIYEETAHLTNQQLTAFCYQRNLTPKQVSLFLKCVMGIGHTLCDVGNRYGLAFMKCFEQLRRPSIPIEFNVYTNLGTDAVMQLLLAHYSNSFLICERNRSAFPDHIVINTTTSNLPVRYEPDLLVTDLENIIGEPLGQWNWTGKRDIKIVPFAKESISHIEEEPSPTSTRILYRIANSTRQKQVPTMYGPVSLIFPSTIEDANAYSSDGARSIVRQSVVLDRWSNATGPCDMSQSAPTAIVGIAMDSINLESLTVVSNVAMVNRGNEFTLLILLASCQTKSTLIKFGIDSKSKIVSVKLDDCVVNMPDFAVDFDTLEAFNNLSVVLGMSKPSPDASLVQCLASLKMFAVSSHSTIRRGRVESWINAIVVNGRYDVASMKAFLKPKRSLDDYESDPLRFGF